MKVWVVFSAIEDYDGPCFEAVCDSLESSRDFIKNKVTAEVKQWTWMEERYQESNIIKKIKDYRADETEVFSVGLVGSRTA